VATYEGIPASLDRTTVDRALRLYFTESGNVTDPEEGPGAGWMADPSSTINPGEAISDSATISTF